MNGIATDAWSLANAARDADDLESAAAHYRLTLDVHPVRGRHHLGVVLASLGQLDEAESLLREACKLAPRFAPAFHSLALLLLSEGRYSEGWPPYETRRLIPNNVPKLKFKSPEWKGQDVSGKHVLVVCEQGLGDEIMFSRFVPKLRELGATVTQVCKPPVAPLFPGAMSGFSDQYRSKPADFWVYVGSLPFRLGITLDNLSPPAQIPVSTSLGGGIGIVAAGSSRHGHDHLRSLSGDDAATLHSFGRDLTPEATGAKDLLETAGIIANLDLVITVDTAVAHLAGSMGKPTWVLLQRHFTDWRWLRRRIDSPWYPSIRLYRQMQADWGHCLRQFAAT